MRLPAGRGDVEAFARFQVYPGGQDVDVDRAGGLVVLHGRPGVAVGLQARPGRLLELVEDGFDLGGGRLVVRCPGQHSRGVGVGKVQAVGDIRHLRRVAPEHGDASPLNALGVLLRCEVGSRRSPGPAPA